MADQQPEWLRKAWEKLNQTQDFIDQVKDGETNVLGVDFFAITDRDSYTIELEIQGETRTFQIGGETWEMGGGSVFLVEDNNTGDQYFIDVREDGDVVDIRDIHKLNIPVEIPRKARTRRKIHTKIK
jgi:hypothetical protein